MSAADVVREFCAAIDRKDLDAVEALMDEQVVYHNIGAEPRSDAKHRSRR